MPAREAFLRRLGHAFTHPGDARARPWLPPAAASGIIPSQAEGPDCLNPVQAPSSTRSSTTSSSPRPRPRRGSRSSLPLPGAVAPRNARSPAHLACTSQASPRMAHLLRWSVANSVYIPTKNSCCKNQKRGAGRERPPAAGGRVRRTPFKPLPFMVTRVMIQVITLPQPLRL